MAPIFFNHCKISQYLKDGVILQKNTLATINSFELNLFLCRNMHIYLNNHWLQLSFIFLYTGFTNLHVILILVELDGTEVSVSQNIISPSPEAAWHIALAMSVLVGTNMTRNTEMEHVLLDHRRRMTTGEGAAAAPRSLFRCNQQRAFTSLDLACCVLACTCLSPKTIEEYDKGITTN